MSAPPQNPLHTMNLADVLKPGNDIAHAGFQAMGTALADLHKVLQSVEFYLREEHKRQTQTSVYGTVYSNGQPYTVSYHGRRYMDVLALRTDDNTQNVTCQFTIPGLGQTKVTQLLQIISINNMLLAGVSPWVPLNLPEGAQITIPTDPGSATQQQCLYVRYGMEQWGTQ